MRHTTSTAPRRLEQSPAGAIADGLEEYREAARHAHARIVGARRGTAQELAQALYDHQRAELDLARAIGGQGYDHSAEWHQGYDDARHGFPRRLSQTAPYRAGYDRGISAC